MSKISAVEHDWLKEREARKRRAWKIAAAGILAASVLGIETARAEAREAWSADGPWPSWTWQAERAKTLEAKAVAEAAASSILVSSAAAAAAAALEEEARAAEWQSSKQAAERLTAKWAAVLEARALAAAAKAAAAKAVAAWAATPEGKAQAAAEAVAEKERAEKERVRRRTQCSPLLLLVEGGGWSSGSPGTSVRALHDELQDRSAYRSIQVFRVEHDSYMEAFGFFDVSKRGPMAQTLRESGFSPIVVVGHSLGADTARGLARRYPVDMLITLDGVSFDRNDPYTTRAGQWINVYVSEDATGPDWKHMSAVKSAADRNICLKGEHSDVMQMYNKVEKDVLAVLKNCPLGQNTTGNFRNLCTGLPGSNCAN